LARRATRRGVAPAGECHTLSAPPPGTDTMTFLLAATLLLADGPADNLVDNVRPIPPKGAKLEDAVRRELQEGLRALQAKLVPVKGHALFADVAIYEKAVRYALDYDEMYVDKGRDDVKVARNILRTGAERAEALAKGETPWTVATGLVVRGYQSKIDGSYQPYGLVVPANYKPGTKTRLDYWWHGRGEVLTELNFIDGRQRNKGEFTPEGAIVAHPYGRYCNANKFAGEIDSLEILDHLKKNYAIDESRIVARGFSMGGAACWQYATHYPTLFAAAAPGAGFAETKEFLNNFQGENVQPTWWEQKLWRWYDATVYARNLKNLPTVAYSGDMDKQKQAADIMERFLKAEGMTLTHIIGEKAGHKYTEAAKGEINKRIDAIVAKGKPDMPAEIDFTTYTLRYNTCGPFQIMLLGKHWDKSTLRAMLNDGKANITTANVEAFEFRTGKKPWTITLDGESFDSRRGDYIPERVVFTRSGMQWERIIDFKSEAMLKFPGKQGPIDDAFLSRFVMVTPSHKGIHDKTAAWTAKEQAHAIKHWRQQFRGDAPTVQDFELTKEQIADANLILWGDPESNLVIAKIIAKLPIQWTAETLEVNGVKYDAKTHMPALIFPNPLNPRKYVVLNSGFTFREYDYLNNARQVPKLPDYAVIDIATPANSRWPGKIVKAGFFDEMWKFTPNDGQ
jgi:dienelactone hydrolase